MDDINSVLENAARFAAQKGLPRFTRFLDPANAHAAAVLAREHGVMFACWGGYERAERTIGCFYPFDSQVQFEQYPLVCLSAQYNSKFCHPTHRDLLGAFMALGLTRDCIGDIIITDGCAYLFTHEQTASYVAASMTSAGRTSLQFMPLDEIPEIPEPKGSEFSCVVSSLRLDAMLAAAYRLSRSEASSFIRGGLVKVNHLPEERPDVLLKEDTILSLRGRGRIRFVAVNGSTRRQRIGVTFFRYE